jgi:hypothetical protein
MKNMFILLMLSTAVAFVPVQPGAPDTTFYYCVSRSYTPLPDGKTQVFYTDAMQMEDDRSAIRKKILEWSTLVAIRYGGPGKGTGDLNHYPNLEQCQKQIAGTLRLYGDTSRYVITKINF